MLVHGHLNKPEALLRELKKLCTGLDGMTLKNRNPQFRNLRNLITNDVTQADGKIYPGQSGDGAPFDRRLLAIFQEIKNIRGVNLNPDMENFQRALLVSTAATNEVYFKELSARGMSAEKAASEAATRFGESTSRLFGEGRVKYELGYAAFKSELPSKTSVAKGALGMIALGAPAALLGVASANIAAAGALASATSGRRNALVTGSCYYSKTGACMSFGDMNDDDLHQRLKSRCLESTDGAWYEDALCDRRRFTSACTLPRASKKHLARAYLFNSSSQEERNRICKEIKGQ